MLTLEELLKDVRDDMDVISSNKEKHIDMLKECIDRRRWPDAAVYAMRIEQYHGQLKVLYKVWSTIETEVTAERRRKEGMK